MASSRGMGAGTNDWERDWRQTIAAQIKDASVQIGNATAANQQTAVILERVQGKLNEHDADIKELQQRPAGFRSDFSAYGGCLSMAIAAAIALVSLLIGVGGDIVAIYVALHR